MLLQAVLTLAPLFHAHTVPAPAPALPEVAHSLAWSIPDDAFLAIRLNDPKGLIANEQENAWINVLSDPAWLEMDVWSEFGVANDDFSSVWSVVGPVLTECTEAVVWLKEPDLDNPEFHVALRTSDDAMATLIEIASTECTLETIDGVDIVFDEDVAIAWSGGLAMMYIGEEPSEAKSDLAGKFLALKNQTTPAGLFVTTPLGTDRNDEHIEVLIKMGPFLGMVMEEDASADEMPDFFLEEFEAIDWLYSSVSFGAGQAVDSNFVMPFKQDGYLAKFLEFTGEANKDALRRVPADAISAVLGNLDLPGVIYWVVEEMMEADELSEEEFEEAMNEMEDTLGIHILEDFVNNMTGEILQVTFPVDDIDNEMQSMMAFSYGLVVFGVSDDEATERALSSLMVVAEEALDVSKATEDWGTVWDLDVMGMFQFQVGTMPGSMFLSANPGSVDEFVAHAASGSDTPSFLSLLGAGEILDQLNGFQISLYRTDALFDSMTNMMNNVLGMESDPDVEMFMEVFEVASELAGEHLTGLVGASASATDRIRIHSIAR